ncbi:Beta-centractin Actin-related protein 1B [Collichthys lucidus]|uniref:Beta-centractin Actin-related protein 1B n=1 Tax=Collichthys lucidus TaxID=240159 RepID=A0A4U5VAN3_COLLU|nr:Beta-centractin Actin-related protein 1B [Collichthys lucidus]
MESYDILANQPVVIDNGSGVIKAGFAGDQIPKYCFPNYLQANPSSRHEHRGLLSVRYPMEHGIVKDWNDMERIWQYVYSKEQLQTFSEEHPVLLTEAPLNPSKNREKAAEIFFETFNVPALFISMQAVLSLYATGRTTGVVLDSGDGVTHVVPIYEGFAIPHSIMRVDIAGRDVSRYLRLLLRKEGYNFNTSAEFEVVRTVKERACYLSLNPQKDETLETEKAQYVLPDGSTLNIGPARFRAPELLFRPDLIGDESSGIHEVLAYAIQKSDMDLRRTLYSTIVLCGGSTLIKGFGERLLTEVKKLAPKDVKIKISAPQERLYSTWIGGSILASLDTFKKMWVSKREYEEDRARPLVYFLQQVDRALSRASPFAAVGVVVGTVYWSAVTYGAVTVMQVVGHKKGLYVMERADPLFLLMGLPTIPVVLVLGKMIRWEDYIGGIAFVLIKGVLKVYFKQQQCFIQANRHILNYPERSADGQTDGGEDDTEDSGNE